MNGIYVLFFYMPKNMELEIGALGVMNFKKGHYAYVGSAQKGLESRLRRHTKKNKKIHWHIDHLSVHAWDFSAMAIHGPQEMECELASRLSPLGTEVRGFGCSDCRCSSHLFYLGKERNKAVRHCTGMEVVF
ncbi:MAG: GIY-YIG nuclease family protein [Thermoplasmata archaeon]